MTSWISTGSLVVLLAVVSVQIPDATSSPVALKDLLSRHRRVIGGAKVEQGQYPWAVSIRGDDQTIRDVFHICGATIINEWWLVTAAHCFWKVAPRYRNRNHISDMRDSKLWHGIAGEVSVDMQSSWHEETDDNRSTDDNEDEDSGVTEEDTEESVPEQPRTTPGNRQFPRVPLDQEALRRRFEQIQRELEEMMENLRRLPMRDDWSHFEWPRRNWPRHDRMGNQPLWQRFEFKPWREEYYFRQPMSSHSKSASRGNKRNSTHLHFTKILLHPEYAPGDIEYDIALLKLDNPLTFSSNIQPLALSPVTSFPQPHEPCVIMGWGCRSHSSSASEDAYAVTLPVLTEQYCNTLYRHEAGLHPEHEFCAGFKDANKGICMGDSGSGLACKVNGTWTLGGVASATHYQQPHRYPGLFTRVSYFHPWIAEVLKEN